MSEFIEYVVTLKNKDVATVDVASWIRKVTGNQFTPIDSLHIAKCLIRGETWKPMWIDTAENEFCNIETVYDGPENELLEMFKTQQKYRELMEKGAAGDSEAAIEYCRLELAGKVSHAAYA